MYAVRLSHRKLLVGAVSVITISCLCYLPPSIMVTPNPAPYQYPTPQPFSGPLPINPVSLPTICEPIITAASNVNIRKGPSKAFDSIDTLETGNYMSVAGTSESQYGVWWYVVYPPAPGGFAWVWGDAVFATCIPVDLPVVAAPSIPKSQANANPPPKATVTSAPPPSGGGSRGQTQPTETSAPPPSGGGSWGQTPVDLAVIDLYPEVWPLRELYTRITNNGHGTVVNVAHNVLTAIIKHPRSGVPVVITGPNINLTISLVPGETKAYRTYISLDGVNNWYEVTAEILPVIEDPNPGNNRYSETF